MAKTTLKGTTRDQAHSVFSLFGALVLGPGSRNIPLPICNDADCARAELDVWAEMQLAAHEAHEHGEFTTFVGYEATSAPNGTTWHRNVIFRNDNVIRRPVGVVGGRVVGARRIASWRSSGLRP